MLLTLLLSFITTATPTLPTFDPATMPPVPSMVGIAYQVPTAFQDGGTGGGSTKPVVCQTCAASGTQFDNATVPGDPCTYVAVTVTPHESGTCKKVDGKCRQGTDCWYSVQVEWSINPGDEVSFKTDDGPATVGGNTTQQCSSGHASWFAYQECGESNTVTITASTASASATFSCGEACPDATAPVGD